MPAAAGPCFDSPFRRRAAIRYWRKDLYLPANRRPWTIQLSRKNLKNSFELQHGSVLQTTFQFQIDFHCVVYFEEEVAWILEAPIDEWHVELRTARPMISGKFCLDGHSQFVFAAMQNKKSVHLNSKNSLRCNFSFHAVRPKNDFRVSPAFENLFVHFLVASIVATIPACCVHDDP